MTKNEIVNDIKFRQRCSSYGLDWSKFELFSLSGGNYIILLQAPIEEINVLFDQNYNTICIEKCDWNNDYEDLKYYVETKYNIYCNLPSEFPMGKDFGYPFQEFTLKQIIDLSNRIEVMETNHGHSLSTRINGDWYDRDTQENKEYFQMLSYIKFIGEQIKSYFIINYHMQTMGFEVPDIYEYVRTLIIKLNKCIDFYLENNRRPWPADVLRGLGEDYREKKMDGILYDVISLLMQDKGFKIKSDNIDRVQKIKNKDNKKDLSIIAKGLLEILKLSDEDLKLKEENYRQGLIDRNLIIPETYQEEQKDTRDPVLRRTPNKNGKQVEIDHKHNIY